MTAIDEDSSLGVEVSGVQEKYKTAAKILEVAMTAVLMSLKPGANVLELCQQGDKIIEEQLAKVFAKRKFLKGIAMPTCVSVNNIIGHYSPLVGENIVTLKAGDVAKVDMGAHIDGYMASAGHTYLVPPESGVQEATSGRIADVICAAYYASECAFKLCQPGRSASEITKAIASVAKVFNCNPVKGVLSHEIKKDTIDEQVIPNAFDPETRVPDFKFEQNQVYCLDVVMSTGEGKTREGDAKTTIYRKNPSEIYRLKLRASRTLLQEVSKRFPCFPFSLRSIEDKTAKLGVKECVSHNLLIPYPVLYEKEGEYVAQFKFTVLILANSTQKLNTFPLPFVSSQLSIDPTSDLQKILSMSSNRKKKKKAKAKKNNQQPATNPPTQNTAPIPQNTAPIPQNTAPIPQNTAPTPQNTAPIPQVDKMDTGS